MARVEEEGEEEGEAGEEVGEEEEVEVDPGSVGEDLHHQGHLHLPDPIHLQDPLHPHGPHPLHHGQKAMAPETITITRNHTTASLTGEEEASLMTMITGK